MCLSKHNPIDDSLVIVHMSGKERDLDHSKDKFERITGIQFPEKVMVLRPRQDLTNETAARLMFELPEPVRLWKFLAQCNPLFD
jgi:hypothetical protein